MEIFLSHMTLKFDGWPWKTIGHLFTHYALGIISKPLVNSNWSYNPEMLNSGQNRQFFIPRDFEIWQMTLKNNRAPLLCCFKLCTPFHSHWGIQTGVTVWKLSIWVKISNFLPRETLKFDRWLWKTIGHLFCAASISVHHFIAIDEFKLELQSGNAQFGSLVNSYWSYFVTTSLIGWAQAWNQPCVRPRDV